LKKNSEKSMDLLSKFFKGNILSVARLITLVENRMPNAREIMKEIYNHVGNAHIIGITGVPGAGKSTLTAKLAKAYRLLNKTVGVIAIDPSSPFTGGALLGDRIRMQELSGDKDVFIRSLGTRGALGGLSLATSDVINILDAFKKDIIIVETIGTGQDEVEIMKYVHTLMVVTMPGGGDAIQCIKAGILEIGDLYVVNKADHAEVSRAVADIEFMLELGKGKAEEEGWQKAVHKTVALQNEGIDELLKKVDEHYLYLKSSGKIIEKRTKRSLAELCEIINQQVTDAVTESVSEGGDQHDIIEKMAITGELDPYSAADIIIKHLMKKRKALWGETN